MTLPVKMPETFFNNVYLNAIADTPFEGILAIDLDGCISFVNDFFLKALDCKRQDIIGKKVVDVIPHCRLNETIEQGYSIWGETLKIKDKSFLVARFPLRNKHQVVGAVVKTIFPDQMVAKEIVSKLSHQNVNVMAGACTKLYTCMDIIGETPQMLYVKKLARKASRTNSTLLITGESGTGKEIIAQAIHTRSVRRESPFISVNCGAIPENLLESELFGYVDGSFTGAKKGGNPGKFELANGGSILLDEIGDMPMDMQVKLLRVLQERNVWRIGATMPIPLDVRVMASTNTDLRQLVEEKKFRRDLFYRINVLEINMPPLRQRLEDLDMLVPGLIHRINVRIGSNAQGVTRTSLDLLKSYSWPGNVRELENILEQAICWNDEPVIDVNKIPFRPWECTYAAGETAQQAALSLKENERELILQALEQAEGNKTKAAQLLHISRSVLYRKLARIHR